MAYAAVVSVKQTIQRLLDSCRFCLDPSTQENLRFAYKEVTSLQKTLQKADNRVVDQRLDCLDAEVREVVHKLEDFLELHQSDLYLGLDENNWAVSTSSLTLDSERVRQEISWFVERAKKTGQDYAVESDNLTSHEEGGGGDHDDASSSNAGSGIDMVGFSEEIRDMIWCASQPLRPDDYGVVSIIGQPGTGRSYVGKRIFEDVCNCRELSFDCTAWVSIGPNYEPVEIVLLVLAQVLFRNKDVDGEGTAILIAGNEEMSKEYLCSRLMGQRVIIVLDNVCDTKILDYFFAAIPLQNNGSLVLLTTSEIAIARYSGSFYVHVMENFMVNFEAMWFDVIRFLFQPISAELKEAGRKMIENCRKLCLSVAKVIIFLWNVHRRGIPHAPVWKHLADHGDHPVFEVVDELSEMSKIIKEGFSKLNVELARDVDKLLFSYFTDYELFLLNDIEYTKKRLFPERFFPKMEVFSFFGMAGIGKTTLVKKMFEHLKNLNRFDHYVWISLGPEYRSEDILMDILAPIIDKMKIKVEGELSNALIMQLSNCKGFLIVLDDVWNEEPLHYLAKLCPNIKGRAFVTTRIATVAQSKIMDMVREMRLLNKDESWDLLRQKVFAQGSCPRELEKAGKIIAENCDGLPLTIVTVAELLSKAEKTTQNWNEVAKKRNFLFTNAFEDLSKDLLPSYKRLPRYLKLCFLYMGVFPEKYEVPASKIRRLWIAEGLLEPNLTQRVKDFAVQCLSELVDGSLLMVCKKGTRYGVKTCRLNSAFWHLSNYEAVKNKFFLTFNALASDPVEGITKKQRRFCLHNCILLSNKGIHASMMGSISTARSLLCTGPYHHYQLPLCFELRLLRVLDALAIRFYEFPVEAVKLIHLTHLAITCNGKIPPSISKLWNLEFLIVNQHLRIKSFGDSSSYLPMEIWDMKKLRHLQVTGSDLPSPDCGTILPNLISLLDVSPHSCTEEVLKGIPNLEKLRIQIELAPDDTMPFLYLDNISTYLSKLESLKCVVVNPELDILPTPLFYLLSLGSLEKLSLNGLRYPWEYMYIIGQLENLKVLKLTCYAFQGYRWETIDFSFKKLTHLLIEDSDLMCWKTSIFNFIKLQHLSIKHCYNLEVLPESLLQIKMIEVVDCNPYAVNWAKQVTDRKLPHYRTDVVFELNDQIESSWDVGRP